MLNPNALLADADLARKFFDWVLFGDCWTWQGAPSAQGYARFSVRGHQLYAHRLSYELFHGALTAGKVVDHICHRRVCVSPHHLRAVTQKQNVENVLSARVDSKSGIRGVFYKEASKAWAVQVKHNGRRYWGGYHRDAAAAEMAAIMLRNRLFTHNDADRVGVFASKGSARELDPTGSDGHG